MEVYTIGHSTRTAEDFLRLLQTHAVGCVVDVRGFPGSRRYPHFGKEQLAEFLPSAGIAYRHLPELGGRRALTSPTESSAGWRNESFRAYAEHMRTGEFLRGLDALVDAAGQQTTAVMCAEIVPWRCHRWLISDALTARGTAVCHILGKGKTRSHAITSWARVTRDGVLYPAPDTPAEEDSA